MLCNSCGKEFSESFRFCPFCGAAAATPEPAAQEAPAFTPPADDQAGYAQAQTAQQATAAQTAAPPAKKNNQKFFIILSVAAVALIALLIVLITAFGNKSKFSSKEEMQIFLEGVWESHTYEKTLYLVFHDGKLWDVYDASYDLVASAKKYQEPTYESAVAGVMWEWPKYEPGKGKITQEHNPYPIYIMKNGTLKQRKAIYVKSCDSVFSFESFISAFNDAWKKENQEQKEASGSGQNSSNTLTSEQQTKGNTKSDNVSLFSQMAGTWIALSSRIFVSENNQPIEYKAANFEIDSSGRISFMLSNFDLSDKTDMLSKASIVDKGNGIYTVDGTTLPIGITYHTKLDELTFWVQYEGKVYFMEMSRSH